MTDTSPPESTHTMVTRERKKKREISVQAMLREAERAVESEVHTSREVRELVGLTGEFVRPTKRRKHKQPTVIEFSFSNEEEVTVPTRPSSPSSVTSVEPPRDFSFVRDWPNDEGYSAGSIRTGSISDRCNKSSNCSCCASCKRKVCGTCISCQENSRGEHGYLARCIWTVCEVSNPDGFLITQPDIIPHHEHFDDNCKFFLKAKCSFQSLDAKARKTILDPQCNNLSFLRPSAPHPEATRNCMEIRRVSNGTQVAVYSSVVEAVSAMMNCYTDLQHLSEDQVKDRRNELTRTIVKKLLRPKYLCRRDTEVRGDSFVGKCFVRHFLQLKYDNHQNKNLFKDREGRTHHRTKREGYVFSKDTDCLDNERISYTVRFDNGLVHGFSEEDILGGAKGVRTRGTSPFRWVTPSRYEHLDSDTEGRPPTWLLTTHGGGCLRLQIKKSLIPDAGLGLFVVCLKAPRDIFKLKTNTFLDIGVFQGHTRDVEVANFKNFVHGYMPKSWFEPADDQYVSDEFTSDTIVDPTSDKFGILPHPTRCRDPLRMINEAQNDELCARVLKDPDGKMHVLLGCSTTSFQLKVGDEKEICMESGSRYEQVRRGYSQLPASDVVRLAYQRQQEVHAAHTLTYLSSENVSVEYIEKLLAYIESNLVPNVNVRNSRLPTYSSGRLLGACASLWIASYNLHTDITARKKCCDKAMECCQAMAIDTVNNFRRKTSPWEDKPSYDLGTQTFKHFLNSFVPNEDEPRNELDPSSENAYGFDRPETLADFMSRVHREAMAGELQVSFEN